MSISTIESQDYRMQLAETAAQQELNRFFDERKHNNRNSPLNASPIPTEPTRQTKESDNTAALR